MSHTRIDWPDLGIAYYARQFAEGESYTFPPQVGEIGTSPNITLLPEGLIRTYNASREDPLDVPARPGRIYGGLLLPGEYTIEALAPSLYVCLAVYPEHLLVFHGVPMFKLDNHTLNAGDTLTLDPADGYRAAICLYGECEVNGQTLTAGQKVLIDSAVAAITCSGFCELASYRELDS